MISRRAGPPLVQSPGACKCRAAAVIEISSPTKGRFSRGLHLRPYRSLPRAVRGARRLSLLRSGGHSIPGPSSVEPPWMGNFDARDPLESSTPQCADRAASSGFA